MQRSKIQAIESRKKLNFSAVYAHLFPMCLDKREKERENEMQYIQRDSLCWDATKHLPK